MRQGAISVQLETQVLLVSAGLVHPSLLTRFWLRRGLAALPGYRFHRVASLEALLELSLEPYCGIVLYVHHDTISPPALECLERFLGRGGGLLALHSAAASFKGEERYSDLLGGSFREHGPIETFEVQQAAPGDDIFGDVPAFLVKDELYRHDYDPCNQVHFYTMAGSEREPVVWTRRLPAPGSGSGAAGRVCHCALGHTVSSVRHPRFQQILRRGLAWVCGLEAVP
jgi:type 1 glutamine amidotransferase